MKAIMTKYHGPTNTRGSRVSASDSDGNRVSIPYQSEGSSHDAAAIKLCRKMNWKCKLVSGGTKNGNVYVMLPLFGEPDIIDPQVIDPRDAK